MRAYILTRVRLVLSAVFAFLLLSAPPALAQGGGVGINFHVGEVQTSREDAALALINVDRCQIVITMAPDGTLAGQCGGPGDNASIVNVTGTVDLKLGSVSFTYDITEHKRYFETDLRGTWHLVYHGTGNLTGDKNESSGDTVGVGTASFEYTCQSGGSASWCGRYGGLKSESFAGTLPWSGLFPAAAVRKPIIFLPGIAGSVLQLEGVVWDSDLWPLAPLASRGSLALKRDGETPATQGIRILAPDIIRSVGPKPVYSPLMQSLADQGYKKDTDLFIFPYDWRLDNTRQVLRLAALVDEVLQKTGAPKVNILTHSMGGLIARAYVNSAGKNKVDTLITISMPFYGSPVAYYALVNGYTFGNFSVSPELIKTLGQNWPAPYQISPRKPFIIDATTNQTLSLADAYRIRYKGLAPDTFTLLPDNSWTFNPDLVQRANDFHALLVDKSTGQEKPLPDRVKQYAIMGYGVRTLSWYRLRDAQAGESYLELDSRKVVLEPQFLDGDGTVPLWGLEFSTATRKYFVPYQSKDKSSEHTALSQNPTTYAIIKNILNGTPPASNTYLPPAYVDLNTFLYFFEGINFTLHSDAHLSIVDRATGQRLGFNEQGAIEEQIPTGSFLSMDGVEYASLAELPASYLVSVTGTNDGNFHLSVELARAGQTTEIEYPEVAVKKGTLAQLTLNPADLNFEALPPLQVTTDGQTTSVNAQVTNQTGPENVPPVPTASAPVIAAAPTLPASTVVVVVPTGLPSPIPPTRAPVATKTLAPTETPLPAYPPGVYVTQIGTEPAEPKRRQEVAFPATFVNTTGAPQQYKWLIQIYDAETHKRFGETLLQPLTVPPGTSVQISPNNWKVTGDGACVSFYAQAQFQNADGGRIPFPSPDGSSFRHGFTVCP